MLTPEATDLGFSNWGHTGCQCWRLMGLSCVVWSSVSFAPHLSPSQKMDFLDQWKGEMYQSFRATWKSSWRIPCVVQEDQPVRRGNKLITVLPPWVSFTQSKSALPALGLSTTTAQFFSLAQSLPCSLVPRTPITFDIWSHYFTAIATLV